MSHIIYYAFFFFNQIKKNLFDYSKAIKQLNNYRLQKKKTKFDILLVLPISGTSKLVHEPTPPQNDHEEALQLLKFITKKFDGLKGDCVWNNSNIENMDTNTVKVLRLLINLSKAWLEQQ